MISWNYLRKNPGFPGKFQLHLVKGDIFTCVIFYIFLHFTFYIFSNDTRTTSILNSFCYLDSLSLATIIRSTHYKNKALAPAAAGEAETCRAMHLALFSSIVAAPSTQGGLLPVCMQKQRVQLARTHQSISGPLSAGLGRAFSLSHL